VKRIWQRYAGRFDALSLRERAMVFAASASVLLAFAYTGLLDAENARQKRLVSLVAQQQAEMRALESQVGKLIAARGEDPDLAAKLRLAEARAELGRIEAGISAEERRFTAPAQMRSVVDGILARNRAVTLQTLRTLPVTSIAETRPAQGPAAKPAASVAPDRLIFRHGIELVVSGSYLDLLGYVRELESLPTQLYWGALELDAAVYPKVVMKLTVYTLSLDRAWLNV
jgi:MSHA biogenesis protein MshJ